ANNGSATVAEDGVSTITLSATDGEGDTLTYAITTQPTHGAVSLSGSTATYTPTAGYNGSDSFTFTANDGSDTSNSATVSITVTTVNDAPQTVLTPTISGGSATFVFAAVDVDSSSFTFTCALDGAAPAPCTSPQQYSSLSPGNHRFAVYATDQDGAVDATPATHTWDIAAATITIILDAQPNLPTNLGFQSSFGPFILDDPTIDDGDAYTNTRTFTVTPGVYSVRRNNPVGWFTTAIVCTPTGKATITLPQRLATIMVAGDDHVTCTYTVARSVMITARAFNDLVRTNANLGKRNGGDPWLTGQPMTLTTSPTQTLGSAVTAPVGNVSQASFINLRPGSYTLCTSFPTGWTLTTPMAVDPAYGQPCKRVTLTPGQVATVLFGAYETTVVASDADTPADETITDDDNIVDRPYDPTEDETLEDETLAEGTGRLFLPLILR
ncbi:MAG: cadherin-like domain-containing protein, partial [Caldilineaceae bacterium]